MSKRGRQDDQESVLHAIELISCRTPARSETEGLSLTPLEQQVVALKASVAPHVILMVACGYRVKFYGCDSHAVSRRVGIMCIPGQPFEYSSFPYTRVDLYVHRLVAMGYQVGFADQESAAMRAADGLKSGLFTRTVSQLYSRATLLPTERVVTNGGNNTHSGGGGGGDRGASTATSAKAGPENEMENSDNEEADGAADAAAAAAIAPDRRAPHSAVDASELFLCFLRAMPANKTTGVNVEEEEAEVDVDAPSQQTTTTTTTTTGASNAELEMTLVSFVTQRRLRFVVRTTLEMEDITQRLDIAEVVVLTHHNPYHAPPQLPRTPPRDGAVQGADVPSLRRSTAVYLAALPEAYSVALHHALPLHFGPTANGEEDDKNVTVSGYVMTHRQSTDEAITAYLKPFKLDQAYTLMCARARTVPSTTVTEVTKTISAGASSDSVRGELNTDVVNALQNEQESSTAALPSLHLPGPTLRALDIFHSSVGLRGSLLGLLDHSVTPCGARCLRRWLAAPLCTRRAIEARQAATSFLARGGDGGQVEELLRECARLGDVEAVVGKLHAERCQVVEFVRLLRMVCGVSALAYQLGAETAQREEEGKGEDEDEESCPQLIRQLLSTVCGPAVAQLLDANAALLKSAATTPLEFFTEGGRTAPESLQVHWEAKKAAEAALEAELQFARSTLGLPGLEYRTIAGTSYLLDVPQGKCSRVPADWVVQTRIKTHVRYHTPVIVEQHIARTAAVERLGLAAAAAWRQYQREVVADAAVMRALSGVVEAIGALDVLHSLALTSRQPAYVMPRVVDLPSSDTSTTTSAVALSIREGRHPMLDQLLPHGYVSCCVELRAGGAWLLTGPNMGGKSALMRMVGTFAVLAQVGCGVPAEAATMPVFAGLYCRMGASDSILEGSSTFLSEMDETSRILRSPCLSSSLVLMDELGRGTSSFDGAAVAAATLEYLLAQHATTMFVTHYSYLCDPFMAEGGGDATTCATENTEEGKRGVSCYYMGYRETEMTPGDASSRQLVFTYKPCKGVTPSSFGVVIAKKAGLPTSVTEAASVLSEKVEHDHRMKQDMSVLKELVQTDSA